MSAFAARFAAAAASLVGTPFRLHGRDPATGLDCVGLVASGLEMAGRSPPVLPDYTLRNLSIARFLGLLTELGLESVTGPVRPGDLLLCKPGPGQFHLGIASGDEAVIHAHAGVGRVVAAPWPWPQAGHWRFTH